MRSKKEVQDKIDRLFLIIRRLQHDVDINDCGVLGRANSKVYIHQLSQEVRLLKWVLEPEGS